MDDRIDDEKSGLVDQDRRLLNAVLFHLNRFLFRRTEAVKQESGQAIRGSAEGDTETKFEILVALLISASFAPLLSLRENRSNSLSSTADLLPIRTL